MPTTKLSRGEVAEYSEEIERALRISGLFPCEPFDATLMGSIQNFILQGRYYRRGDIEFCYGGLDYTTGEMVKKIIQILDEFREILPEGVTRRLDEFKTQAARGQYKLFP